MSLSTSCINGYSYFISSNSKFKNNHKLKDNTNLLCIRSIMTTRLVLQNQRVASLRTNAIADSLTLAAATPPAKSGDITVFLLTSAVLFFIYWMANFVAPDLISKYYEFDKIDEDQNQKPNDKR